MNPMIVYPTIVYLSYILAKYIWSDKPQPGTMVLIHVAPLQRPALRFGSFGSD